MAEAEIASDRVSDLQAAEVILGLEPAVPALLIQWAENAIKMDERLKQHAETLATDPVFTAKMNEINKFQRWRDAGEIDDKQFRALLSAGDREASLKMYARFAREAVDREARITELESVIAAFPKSTETGEG